MFVELTTHPQVKALPEKKIAISIRAIVSLEGENPTRIKISSGDMYFVKESQAEILKKISE